MKSNQIKTADLFIRYIVLLCIFICAPQLSSAQSSTISQDKTSESKTNRDDHKDIDNFFDKMDKWYQEHNDRFIMVMDAQLFYNYTDPHGDANSHGPDFRGIFAPTIRTSEETFGILMYDGIYYERQEFYSDDTGYRERSKFQSHTVSPMFRIDFGAKKRFSLTPSIFLTNTYNKDFDNSHWQDGLYNLRDRGIGVDFIARRLDLGGAVGILNTGAQYYEREYPNYVSLLDLAAGIGIEEDEKDYRGIIYKAGYEWLRKFGFSSEIEYSVLYKRLLDKRVVNQDGVLDSTKQRDWLHALDLDMWYSYRTGITLMLGLSGGLYESNQNYYDGMNTLLLSDDVFTPDFYDYHMVGVNPGISYQFEWIPLFASLSYEYQKLDYDERRAQNADGTYKGHRQYEIRRSVEFEIEYEIAKNLSLVGQYVYTDVKSNNDNESIYNYEYSFSRYTIGISYYF